MDELHNLLLERAKRAFKQTTITEVWNSRRAIVGTANMPGSELAEEALLMLKKGQEPSPKQLQALEIAIRLMRPAPLSKRGNLQDLSSECSGAFEHWGVFQNLIRPFLYSIGRIDQAPDKAIGTGFIVGSGLLVTNKHVLDLLSAGTQVLEKTQAVVRFKHEYMSVPDEAPIAIVRVRAVHPSLDIALLEIEKSELIEDRPFLPIDPTGVAIGHPVVAVGYPANDPVRNPLFIRAIFGNSFGVKRAAPGEVTRLVSQSIFHDCSTLGGNSGSPLLSMKSARVVGMHRDGFFMYRNEAVDGASLSEFVKKNLNDGGQNASTSNHHLH